MQLQQRELPCESAIILCRLAEANKYLARTTAKTRIAAVWMQQLQEGAYDSGPKTCTPEDVEAAVARLTQLAPEQAVKLVECAVAVSARHGKVTGKSPSQRVSHEIQEDPQSLGTVFLISPALFVLLGPGRSFGLEAVPTVPLVLPATMPEAEHAEATALPPAQTR